MPRCFRSYLAVHRLASTWWANEHEALKQFIDTDKMNASFKSLTAVHRLASTWWANEHEALKQFIDTDKMNASFKSLTESDEILVPSHFLSPAF